MPVSFILSSAINMLNMLTFTLVSRCSVGRLKVSRCEDGQVGGQEIALAVSYPPRNLIQTLNVDPHD